MQEILDSDPCRRPVAPTSRTCRYPSTTAAVTVHADEVEMFAGVPVRERDPRKSLHVERRPDAGTRPGRGAGRGDGERDQLQHGLDVDLRADADRSRFLAPLRQDLAAGARHDLPYHVVGSDLAGVVLRTGPGVQRVEAGRRGRRALPVGRAGAPGGPRRHDAGPEQRIWGFETNFGGLAELALVKANQLMPKPGHLTWEEAACPGLVNSTAYRQLVSQQRRADEARRHGARLGGVSGGPGLLRHPDGDRGRRHSGVRGVQPRAKAADLPPDGRRAGASTARRRATGSGRTSTPRTRGNGGASARGIRELTGGRDVDIVFEHPGRETFGASVFVVRRGGTDRHVCVDVRVTRTSYDNRYLWMNLKRIVGSHFANYAEAWAANDLIRRGLIHPTLSRTYPLDRCSAKRHSTSTVTFTRARWE